MKISYWLIALGVSLIMPIPIYIIIKAIFPLNTEIPIIVITYCFFIVTTFYVMYTKKIADANTEYAKVLLDTVKYENRPFLHINEVVLYPNSKEGYPTSNWFIEYHLFNTGKKPAKNIDVELLVYLCEVCFKEEHISNEIGKHINDMKKSMYVIDNPYRNNIILKEMKKRITICPDTVFPNTNHTMIKLLLDIDDEDYFDKSFNVDIKISYKDQYNDSYIYHEVLYYDISEKGIPTFANRRMQIEAT